MSEVPEYVQHVLARFEGVIESGDGWKALCPAHADVNPSLHISLGESGHILLKDHGGCHTADVMEAAGLEYRDLFPPKGAVTMNAPKASVETVTSSAKLRSVVYTKLLEFLPLHAHHIEDLHRRGLTDDVIAANGYRSLSVVAVGKALKKLQELYETEELSKVPGFRLDSDGRITLTAKDGLLIPVRGSRGSVRGLQVRTTDGPSKYLWLSGDGGPRLTPLPAHVRRNADQDLRVVTLTEGPLKADVIHHLDNTVPVVAVPGVASWKSALSVLKAGSTEEVLLAFDMDWSTKDGVRQQVLACARELVQHYRVQLALWDPAEAKGFDDLLAARGVYRRESGTETVLRLLATHRPAVDLGEVDELEEEDRQAAEALSRAGTGAIRMFNEIETKPVDWFWKPWIPRGVLTMLEGDPGKGKSTFTLDLIARATTGRPMPPTNDFTPAAAPSRVLLISAEDDPHRIIRPRLDAAGADVRQIGFFDGVWTSDGTSIVPFVLPDHLDRLEDAIRRGGFDLVVVDPLMAFLSGEVDSYKDSEVRHAVMAPLAKLVADTNVGFLMVRHLNKAGGQKALYRGSGSIAILAAARAVMLGADHPEDPEQRVIVWQKGNLAPPPDGLAFGFESGVGDFPRLVYRGTVNFKADDLLRPPVGDRDSPQLEKAMVFLDNVLSKTPTAPTTLKKWAKAQGISPATLERAKVAMKLVYQDDPKDKRVKLWALPPSE